MSDTQPSPEPEHDVDVALMLELGKTLHAYGTPARRLERVLGLVAERLALELQVFAAGTVLIASFGPGTQLRTALVRLEPREFDLGKLRELDRVVAAFLHGTADKHELHRSLLQIRVHTWHPPLATSVGVRVIGATSWAFLLGGRIKEALASGVAAALVAGLELFAQRRGWLSHEFTSLAACLVAATVMGCAAWFGPLAPQIANLAALVPLLPGLGLVIATEELAFKDMISGTSRLVAAGMVFAQLIFGVALGSQLSRLVDEDILTTVEPPLSFELQCLLLIPALGALAFEFRAARRDLPWIVAAGVVGFSSARLGARVLGIELGAFVGALTVGVFGNAVARWLHRPSLLIIVPGIYVLLPGALGFRSVDALWSQQPLEGIKGAFSVAMIAVALATGLIVSSSALPPRRML